jgi:5'-3' exoribonuclease 2
MRHCCFRINTTKGWHNIKVILSDASQPGEGEHKVMTLLRCCSSAGST